MKDLLSIDFFHPKSKLGYLQRHFDNFLSILQRVSSEKQHFELKTSKASNSKGYPKKTITLPGRTDWRDSAVSSAARHLTALTSAYGSKAELTERTQGGGPAGPRATALVAPLQISAEPREQIQATYKLSLCLNFCSWKWSQYILSQSMLYQVLR